MVESSLPTVAVTGASGLLGRHLRAGLRDRPVVLLGRQPIAREAHETWRRFDLADPEILLSLPAGSSLCHLAYAMSEGSRNLDYTHKMIAAVNDCPAVERVIMMSSASVYGARTEGVIDEETPLRPDSSYARTKAACDQAWLELLRADCRLTVLRPSSIVAADGPALATLTRDAARGSWRGVLKKSLQQRNSVHFVAAANVVAATRFVLDRPGSHREVFLVSDDDEPQNASYATMQDFVRAELGHAPLRSLPVPRALERPVGALLGKPLGVRRTFSADRLAAAGFVRPTRLGVELAASLRRQAGPAARPDPSSER